MGYIKHSAVVVVIHGSREQPDVETFRSSLPEEFQPLVIGPVDSVVNTYRTYAFLPDGSKEGWTTDHEADAYRERFIALFEDPDGVVVDFGGDFGTEVGARATALREEED